MRCIRLLGSRRAHIAVVLLFTVFAAAASVAGESFPYEARITAPGAPVHSGPGESFYPTDTLAQGDAVQVYKEQPGGWLGIRPPQDSFSWVFGKHLKLLDNGLAEVDKADVPSRIGSRLSDKREAVQVKLKKGEPVEILGEQTIDGQTWYKIAPPSGEFRWIQARNVSTTDQAASEEAVLPPVVTVPVESGSAPHEDDAVTTVADSQPAATEQWRAAPIDAAGSGASVSTAAELAAPPLTTTADTDARGATNAVVRGSPVPALSTTASTPATPATIPNASAQTPKPVGPIADGLARQLTEVEMRLSRIVAESPATWQIEPLERELEQLLAQAQTPPERTAVQSTLAKVDRFAAIGRRYRQVGVSTTPAGQLPITPIGGAPVGIVAADGQQYDAVGILRPVVSKRPGAPQFALLNERGQVVSFVTPTPDVNLQPYVGHRIGITGTRGYIPEFQRAHVTAGRVAPLSERMLR